MPRLWSQTIETHRAAVREAILDTTAALMAEQGLRSVTMSGIAEGAGIGRATLYTYFPDVEAILSAWHQRQVHAHVHQLTAARDQAGDASQRLEAVLRAYVLTRFGNHTSELAAALHRDEHVARAEAHLHRFVRDLVAEGATAGVLRDDVAPGELATYALHALDAASALTSKTAVHRLVTVTLAGLAPPRTQPDENQRPSSSTRR